MSYRIFFYIFINSLLVKINCQVLRNSYSNVYNSEMRDQYLNERHYSRDQYNFRDRSQHMKIGFDSEYSDSRCIGNRSPNFNIDHSITVHLRVGDVTGTIVYLCDGPGHPEYDRPNSRYGRSPKIYRNITVFLGIPYALPPTKDLRFRPPQVQPSFTAKYALEYRSSCLQHPKYTGSKTGITDTSEDCLNLNVFTPSVNRYGEKYAVMVYIHGGNWDHGSGKTFPAHMLAASQNVIVVTFNYRLGPLGFYANGQNSSAGNYGLLDQALAIEWVYDNIGDFNGDNERITLFGPDVGAASAVIQALSLSVGRKVRRVIAQSGSAVADWALIRSNYTVFNNSLEYALLLNCYFQSSWRIVSCLQSLPSHLFESKVFEPKVGWFPWSPVLDYCTRDPNKRILPDTPENLIKSHYENLHYDFGYLAGVTKDEASSFFLQDPEIKRENYILSLSKFHSKIQQYASIFNYTLDIPALTKAVEFMYFPPKKDIDNQTLLREGYINMLSDSYFVAPNDKMIKLLLERNIRTYAYVLNNSLEGLEVLRNHPLRNITPHDTEYFLITGAPFMDPKLYPVNLNLQEARWTEADRNLSEFLMTTWANFAKFGNPTPKKVFNISWEPITLKDMQYLLINTTNFTSVMQSSYRQKECQFWSSFLPTLMKLEMFPSTYCRPLFEPWEHEKHVYEASLWGIVAVIVLSVILCILCSCLYCRAKSKHIVSSEDIPDSVSVTPYSIDSLVKNWDASSEDKQTNYSKVCMTECELENQKESLLEESNENILDCIKRSEAGNRYLAERLRGEQKHTQV